MDGILLFFIKTAITQSILFCVYWLLFRRDTFHTMNRWYLMGTIVLSSVVPFINIDILPNTSPAHAIDTVYQYVPNFNITQLHWWQKLDSGTLIVLISLFVTGFLLIRILLQWFALRNIRASRVVEHENFRLCIVDDDVKPFSFGHNIYINPAYHRPEELNEIIVHEMVHVLQRHSVDIILATINRSIFWWNPFAWVLTNAMKQNLEFICDGEVLSRGFDPRHYQYNLLRISQSLAVTSIGQHFNFSNLKNRIQMMNREKTKSFHRMKWLAILPIMTFVLLAFNRQQTPAADTVNPKIARDTVPTATVTKDVQLSQDSHVEIPSPPPPAPPARMHNGHPVPPPPPPPPPKYKLPPNVESIMISDSKTTVTLKDGKKEYYNMDDKDQRKDFEKKYGPPTPPPPPPPPPAHAQDVVGLQLAPSIDAIVATDVQAPVATVSLDRRTVAPKIPDDLQIMLDGKEIPTADLNKINPNTIEKINMVKGESAKAKYGDKAKSGVIEITTKTKH